MLAAAYCRGMTKKSAWGSSGIGYNQPPSKDAQIIFMAASKPPAKSGASIHPKIGFVSLGCPKALVDSERIITRLRSDGYRIATTYQDADLVVVNTCGFIDSAKAVALL